jgi:hypothetical protein
VWSIVDLHNAQRSLNMEGWSDCGSGCPAVLEFTNQALTRIKPTAFDSTGLTHVTVLDLSFNQLTTMPVRVFDKLTALASLFLDGNKLTTMPVGVFDRLTALSTLRLPLASQFECFVSLPSSVTVYTSSDVVADRESYNALPRCGECGQEIEEGGPLLTICSTSLRCHTDTTVAVTDT